MSNSGLSDSVKRKHLNQLAEYRDEELRPHPALHSLFFELTINCNEHCLHCGSKCGDISEEAPLTVSEWKHILDDVKKDFGTDTLRLCITGGEPLLNKDFFDIMGYAHSLGFDWGMTSNGTLITPEVAHKLAETGMRTISISVDGLKDTHDWFRQVPGSYERTMTGIRNLLNEKSFNHVQVTTVVHHRNIGELDEMYEIMKTLGIRSWRVINIEPIGRAKDNPELMLTADEYKYVLDFIRTHRFESPMEVTYGCSHFLPIEYEREVRKWYFLCNAGVYTASIMYNGNIGACLDIERRPELVEGNIRRDSFQDVWEKGFKIYRSDFRKCGPCKDCPDYKYCAGDSFHTWNFDKMEPNLCLRKLL